MSDNILDQSDDNSLDTLKTAFYLLSEEDLDGRLDKVLAIWHLWCCFRQHDWKSVSQYHINKSEKSLQTYYLDAHIVLYQILCW